MSDFWIKEAVSILRQNGSQECAEAVASLAARLAEAEERLQEACERMSKAETTSRVLTGQLPEYSEGRQMLSSLSVNMGDSVRRICAFLNKVWDEKNEEELL